MIFDFEDIKAEIISAMQIWAAIIIPSVFPYMILSSYISVYFSEKEKIGFPGKLISKILKINPKGIGAVISSFICGYPSGAICARGLYEDGIIDKIEAKRLILFTNNAGPLFLISAVGTNMLKSTSDGFAVYLIQLISAFIYAIVIPGQSKAGSYTPKRKIKKQAKANLCSIVSTSVVNTTNICGFMIISALMSRCVLKLISVFNGHSYIYEVFTKAIFEISTGTKAASMLADEVLKIALICAFVSWSGISVILQISSTSSGICSISELSKAKLCQAIMSFGMGYIYKSIFREEVLKISTNEILYISIILSITIFIIYVIKGRKISTESSRG